MEGWGSGGMGKVEGWESRSNLDDGSNFELRPLLHGPYDV